MWGGQKSYSFMVVHESFRDDNNRINIGDEQKQDAKDDDDQVAHQIESEFAVCFETSCYFHSDKKHDWSTALNVIKSISLRAKNISKMCCIVISNVCAIGRIVVSLAARDFCWDCQRLPRN
eukprot:944847_1